MARNVRELKSVIERLILLYDGPFYGRVSGSLRIRTTAPEPPLIYIPERSQIRHRCPLLLPPPQHRWHPIPTGSPARQIG